MTTPKLPEPKHPAGILHNYPFLPDLYTADQVRAILEIAAKECEAFGGFKDGYSCASLLRTLKEQL
jgi:hypothetical protein